MLLSKIAIISLWPFPFQVIWILVRREKKKSQTYEFFILQDQMQISFNCSMHFNGQVIWQKIEEQEDKMLNLGKCTCVWVSRRLVHKPEQQAL